MKEELRSSLSDENFINGKTIPLYNQMQQTALFKKLSISFNGTSSYLGIHNNSEQLSDFLLVLTHTTSPHLTTSQPLALPSVLLSFPHSFHH